MFVCTSKHCSRFESNAWEEAGQKVQSLFKQTRMPWMKFIKSCQAEWALCTIQRGSWWSLSSVRVWGVTAHWWNQKKGIIFYTIFWQSPCKCRKLVAAWQKQQRAAQDYLWGVQSDLDVQVSQEGKWVVFWILVELQLREIRSSWQQRLSPVYCTHPQRACTAQHLSGLGPYVHFAMLPVKVELIKNAQRNHNLWFRFSLSKAGISYSILKALLNWRSEMKLENKRTARIARPLTKLTWSRSWLPWACCHPFMFSRGLRRKHPSRYWSGDRQLWSLVACSWVDHRFTSSPFPCLCRKT